MRVSVLSIALLLSACNYVYRKADVYEVEVRFLERASVESGKTLSDMVSTFCKCNDGAWSAPICAEASVNAAILQQRVPHHTAMMLYLADLAPKPSSGVSALVVPCGDAR